MPRTCFVIMPFSGTTSCNDEQWTDIFENLFKTSVEGAGLDYECRRSTARRGNIVKDIIRDLNDAHVVLADLTDQNANVFYELCVRHALKNRTIIVAQRRGDIPFDLKSYANHVYNWQTPEGRKEFGSKIKELLVEIDQAPDRDDSPVSDFLIRAPSPVDKSVQVADVTQASMVGTNVNGGDGEQIAARLSSNGRPGEVRRLVQATKRDLRRLVTEAVIDLGRREIAQQVSTEKIPLIAESYVEVVAPLMQAVEAFTLQSVEDHWQTGLRAALDWVGELISITSRSAASVRFAKGAPAFLGVRLLMFGGAKAIADNAFEALGTVINGPIEVEESGGRYTHRSLVGRRDLFFPDAFLGYADYPMLYVGQLWSKVPHIHGFFVSTEDYHLSLAKFLMILAIADAREPRDPLYPGYRLVPQARRAMSSLAGRLTVDSTFIEGIALAFGETPAEFRQKWQERASRANSAGLGHKYMPSSILFPESVDETGAT